MVTILAAHPLLCLSSNTIPMRGEIGGEGFDDGAACLRIYIKCRRGFRVA